MIHPPDTLPPFVQVGMLLRHPLHPQEVWEVQTIYAGDPVRAKLIPAGLPPSVTVPCPDIRQSWRLAAEFDDEEETPDAPES